MLTTLRTVTRAEHSAFMTTRAFSFHYYKQYPFITTRAEHSPLHYYKPVGRAELRK